MKKAILCLLLLVSNLISSQEIDPNKYYAETKTVFLESKAFNAKREIQIFLPDEYYKKSEKKFKVVYLFDAQNQRVFNYVRGNVELLSMNFIEPVIIVGIVTEDRWFEFLPQNKHAETLKEYEPPIGGADILISHIENEVETYLNENYRTQKYRIGIGHSLGGTFVTYFNTVNKNFFDATVLLSPNFAYDSEQMIERIKKMAQQKPESKKEFYVFSGFGDSYEEKFNASLFKVNKWFNENKTHNFIWKYEKLNINDHGKIWLEGVYKGLLKIEGIKK